jgi:DMSO/TMAO reductase YedYZ molybdopterin-dependent catalytic subunit
MKRNFLIATTLIISVFALTALVLTSAASSANSPFPEAPEWQLTVSGFVANPMNLSWAEIVALPQSIVYAEIICVNFPD